MNLSIRNIRIFVFYVFTPLLLGSFVSIINSEYFSNYDGIVPGFVFPIVWSILYILMGISSYLVRDDKRLIRIYFVNLIVNLLWTFIFFMFDMKVLAFFWILLLIVIVGIMIYEFYKKNKVAAYLLIPYLLWLIFASILNLLQII